MKCARGVVIEAWRIRTSMYPECAAGGMLTGEPVARVPVY